MQTDIQCGAPGWVRTSLIQTKTAVAKRLVLAALTLLSVLLPMQQAWAGCEFDGESGKWYWYNPSITLNSPANGASFVAPATVSLTSSPFSDFGTVTKVEYFSGTTLIATATAAPWSASWSGVGAGTYSITAKVTDSCAQGTRSTTSAAASVTVTAGGIIGNIDGITTGTDGKPYLAGWACDKNVAQSISVHLYRNGAAGTGVAVGAYSANQASEAGVSSACGTSAVAHRFSIPLAGLEPYQGQALYVHGISTSGGANSLVSNSGTFKVPNNPPTVSIAVTSGAGAAAPATVIWTASPSDPNGNPISKVEFFQSAGGPVLYTANAAPWTYTSSGLSAGYYEMRARAFDNQGAAGESGAAGVTVNANPAPVVNLTINTNSGVAPATIKLSMSVSDADGYALNNVRFLANGAQINSQSQSFLWTEVAAGTYSIQAQVTDNYGTTTTTPAQTVVVAASPSFAALTAEQTTQTRTSSFDYDPVNGLLIKEVVEPGNSNLCVVTTYTHDAWGNTSGTTTRNCNASGTQMAGGVVEAAAPTGDAVFAARTATTTFDSRGQFATTVKNALNQQETRSYDARFGQMTSLKGPNDLTTTWAYDSFGRKIRENRPDGTFSTWGYSLDQTGANADSCTTQRGFNWPVNPDVCYQIWQIDYANGGAQIGAPSYSYFDKANRKLFSFKRNFENTDWIYVGLVFYDALGRVDKAYRPVASADWASKNSVLYTQNSYDILDRVQSVFDMSGDAAAIGNLVKGITYDGLTTKTFVFPLGGYGTQTTTTVKNVAGQTDTVFDNIRAYVKYRYDALGNLLGTNAQGVLTTMSYDLRGRKTGMVDASMGSWTYAYNAIGELVRQVDAKNQTTTMGYDLLGRMTARAEPDLKSNWEYDSNTYASTCGTSVDRNKGKPIRAYTDGGYNRVHCYDTYGRAIKEVVTLGTGGTFTTSTSYDAASRVDTLTYPNGNGFAAGLPVKNTYNAAGYLEKLTYTGNGAVIWQTTAVDAYGHITGEKMVNGVTTSRTYDNRGRLKSIISTGSNGIAGGVQNNTVTYNNLDTVIQRTWLDATGASKGEAFVYDSVNRLTTVTATNGVVTNYVYDSRGNFATKPDGCSAGACTYNYTANTNRLNDITGTVNGMANPAFAYDANGNLTSGATFSATWMSFNMPKVLGRPSKSDAFTYGPEHQRISQISSPAPNAQVPNPSNIAASSSVTLNAGGTLTTYYVGAFEKEINTATGITEYKYTISAGGRTVAMVIDRSNSTTDWRYPHQDHLGSTVAVTNAAGQLLERYEYDAWGKRRNTDGTPSASQIVGATDRGYTGHEMLDSLGLIHMNGRVYDPLLGRFVSADPFIQAPNDLASYNRYSYVFNDPLTSTDPSGYLRWKDIRNAVCPVCDKSLQGKIRREYKRSEIFRAAVAIGVAWLTQGMMTEFLMAGSSASPFIAVSGGGLTSAIPTTLTTLGSATVSAAGGFAGGLVASGGDLKAAAQGALSGGLSGGIAGHFGSSYPLERVLADGVAGGASSVARGGSFKDGFKVSFGTSALMYLNVQMREQMIQNSLGSKMNDGTGLSAGMNGDGFKLAGGRWNQFLDKALEQCSPLGCQQNGPGKIFGIPYAKGGFVDMVMESFAGPHDFANSPWFYQADGTIKYLSPLQNAVLDYSTNFTTSLIFAAPFAAGAIAQQTNLTAYLNAAKKKEMR